MCELVDQLKNTFSNVIHDYAYARPTYPTELYDQIREFSGISANSTILEVGAGTGQATELFIANNHRLDLLEVSEEQVAYLKEKYSLNSNVTVSKDYFEDYTTNKQFDLIYSATAFHWIKSEIGYPKAWQMLKAGGTMAVFWQMSSVTHYNHGIFVGLNEIKHKYLPDEPLGFDDEGIKWAKQKRIEQIQAGGCFGIPEMYDYRWTDTYDAERYARLLNTYSSTQLLDTDIRKRYLDEVKQYIEQNGGIVEMPQLVCLYLVKKLRSDL